MLRPNDVVKPEFDEDKFKELILYIAGQCEHDSHFGAISLNKQLFYCDTLAYAKLGKPITGADYMALDYGPAPRFLAPIRGDMVDAGDIVVRKKQQFGHPQDRVIPLREPDLSSFSGEEIALIDQVVDLLRGVTAKYLSDFTHGEYGWKIAALRETIPYETVFLSREDVTRDDKQRAEELVIQHGW